MYKRILSLYIFTIFSFMALLGRIVYIQRSEYSSVVENYGRRVVTVGEKRGEIYDRNCQPLVGRVSHLTAVVTPCPAAYSYLREEMSAEALREKIEAGYPFLCSVSQEINNEYIRTFSVRERYADDDLALHIVGYCDSTGQQGITGIEKACDAYLKEASGSLTVNFQVDAVGRALAGMKKTVSDNNFTSKAGVVLSIDSRVQKITEEALENSLIESGCALVMHCHTGEILAMASVPCFDRKNLAKSLEAENSPFVNKALRPYSVGSVFKSVVAAAAIENGIDTQKLYNCEGEITVGDRSFSCYAKRNHGEVNMQTALQKSCNCYFINLISRLDTDYLLKLCSLMGLGQTDELAVSVRGAQGTLPTAGELLNKGELANFSFGQGQLLATPLQIAKAYHVLATGNYVKPQLILGYTDNMGLMTPVKESESYRVLSGEAVISIRKMLSQAVDFSGLPVSLAGKTGTAQSGIFNNEKELLRTWFAGFFPAENPHYIVVVLNENGVSGSRDCTPVFKEICKRIVTY